MDRLDEESECKELGDALKKNSSLQTLHFDSKKTIKGFSFFVEVHYFIFIHIIFFFKTTKTIRFVFGKLQTNFRGIENT